MSQGQRVSVMKLKAAREAAGFTQKALVRALQSAGVELSYGWLANVESGRMRARRDKLNALARALRVKPDDLLEAPGAGERGAVDWLMGQVTALKARVDQLELAVELLRAKRG